MISKRHNLRSKNYAKCTTERKGWIEEMLVSKINGIK